MSDERDEAAARAHRRVLAFWAARGHELWSKDPEAHKQMVTAAIAAAREEGEAAWLQVVAAQRKAAYARAIGDAVGVQCGACAAGVEIGDDGDHHTGLDRLVCRAKRIRALLPSGGEGGEHEHTCVRCGKPWVCEAACADVCAPCRWVAANDPERYEAGSG